MVYIHSTKYLYMCYVYIYIIWTESQTNCQHTSIQNFRRSSTNTIISSTLNILSIGAVVLYALSGLSVSSIVSVSLHLASHRFSDILIHVCIYVILKYYTHNSVWTSVKWCAAARYAVHFVLFSHSFNRRDWKTSRRLFSSPKKTTHCIETTTKELKKNKDIFEMDTTEFIYWYEQNTRN